jgi:hypothetical protein
MHERSERAEKKRGLTLVEPLLALDISYPVASDIVHNLSSQRTSDEYVSLGDEDGLDRGRIREHDRLWRT